MISICRAAVYQQTFHETGEIVGNYSNGLPDVLILRLNIKILICSFEKDFCAGLWVTRYINWCVLKTACSPLK